MKETMSARTPAELKELFESDTFARDTTCTGPLGPEYTLSGTRLRLWAPTAQSVCVNLYRKSRGGVRIGTPCRWSAGRRGCGASICPATSTAVITPLR